MENDNSLFDTEQTIITKAAAPMVTVVVVGKKETVCNTQV